VCKYGSDPLKTYLPNSDIDITLIPVLKQASPSEDSQAAQQNCIPTLSSANFYHELDR